MFESWIELNYYLKMLIYQQVEFKSLKRGEFSHLGVARSVIDHPPHHKLTEVKFELVTGVEVGS